MKIENIRKAANIIYESRRNATGLDKLPDNCTPQNINDAYKIQEQLKFIYLSIKDNEILGKKVGCTNKNAQKQINIHEPFYGNLFTKFSNLSGCTLLSKKFYKPYLEPECSFRINEDINILKAPFKLEQINKISISVIPSIEIVDFRFKGVLKEIGINNLISCNGASEFWIRGKKEFNLNEINLFNQKVEVFINNKLIEKGNTSNVLKNPINSLLWLVNKLAGQNEPLLKDQLITTGTCTKAIPLNKGDEVRVEFESMGKVDFKYN